MADTQEPDKAIIKVLRGVVSGVIAGAVASFAMDRFQASISSLLPKESEQGEPATQKVADVISVRLIGNAVAKPDKPLAGQSIHYAFGIALGVAYAVAAEFRSEVTAGYGTAFGAASAMLFDESIVPILGLGEAPWRASPVNTAYGITSHLVFGSVAEAVRRQVQTTLKV